MTTTAADRLRLSDPIGVCRDESVSLYWPPPSPHCPNTGPRPGWLLSKWHCAQDHQLDQKYGMRCEDYWRLFELQGGRCALCWYAPRRYRLVVHHDHQTGAVVCLLHSPCNRVIDLLMWLLPRLVALMVDPPGRRLGLKVPAAKMRRLETKRPKSRPKEGTNGLVPSQLDKMRTMTQGGA